MERIREAVERAKAARGKLQGRPPLAPRASAHAVRTTQSDLHEPAEFQGRVVKLDLQHLESKRIIADNPKNPLARGFELLRTQLSMRMADSNMQVVGITSPSPDCGKTVCSLNLAFSFARLAQRGVTLVDFDMRKPQVANCIGLTSGPGIESVLRGKAQLDEVVVLPSNTNGRLRIFPTMQGSSNPTNLISSSGLISLVDEIRARDPGSVVIFDLPPVLAVDDVLLLLPHIDIVLMVVAAGQTSIAEIKKSERLIGTSKPIEYVLNKSEEASDTDYRYYY